MTIKTYYCNQDTLNNPDCFEGILDKDGDLWLFDECYAKESEFHGSYVEHYNRKYFEVVE